MTASFSNRRQALSAARAASLRSKDHPAFYDTKPLTSWLRCVGSSYCAIIPTRNEWGQISRLLPIRANRACLGALDVLDSSALQVDARTHLNHRNLLAGTHFYRQHNAGILFRFLSRQYFRAPPSGAIRRQNRIHTSPYLQPC